MVGTSMNDSIIAGNLALVREYFQKGYHVTGEKNEAHGCFPMGSLMKAVMVNSATPLTGSYFDVLVDSGETEAGWVVFNTFFLFVVNKNFPPKRYISSRCTF
jgi:hypothetical protein